MAKEKQARSDPEQTTAKNPTTPTGSQTGELIDESRGDPQVDPRMDVDALPPGLRRSQLIAIQKIAGNRAAQRTLESSSTLRGGGTAAAGNTTPIPKLPKAEARHSLAVDVLKKAYGGLVKVETKVNPIPSEAQLRDRYDQAMIRMGRTFKEEDGTIRPWKAGDSKIHPEMSGDFPGFFDPSTRQVFINTSEPADEQTATMAHELLHASESGDFLATFGKQIDEGMTEHLTQKAFVKSGYTAPAGFFTSQIAFVGRLSGMFGENTMMYSYFSGTVILRSMMNSLLDDSVFDRFALEARNNNTAWMDLFFQRYYQVQGGAEIDKKITVINSLLDGWVSDADLTNIENIYHGSSADEQARLKAVISSRLDSLIDIGQRSRLRILIGD